MVTVDTNVLVYLFDDDRPEKQSIAALVMERVMQADSAIGLQAIGELQNALRHKMRRPAWQAAQSARAVLSGFRRSFAPTETAVDDALAAMSIGQLSYWDALLVASARDGGCRTIISEDMQDDGMVFGVRVLNPFGVDGPSASVRSLLNL